MFQLSRVTGSNNASANVEVPVLPRRNAMVRSSPAVEQINFGPTGAYYFTKT
jgi:hypothetical protein